MKLEAALESPALSVNEEVVAEVAQQLPDELSPKQVADAFVLQYYHILREYPDHVHKFYKDASIMSRLGSEGMMLSANTVQEIDDSILSSTYKEWEPDMKSVHAQESILGSVIVGVTGSLSDKYNTKRTFAQTFLLVPQETGGFYVRNDFMMFLDMNDEPTETVSVSEARSSVFDPTPKEALEILKKDGAPGSLKTKSEILVTKPVENAQEDDPKKISYASILAKEVSLSTSADVSSPPVTVLPKAARMAPSKASAPPTNGTSSVNGSLSAEGSFSSPTGIHIKNLVPDVTQEDLLKAVRKYGIVKPRSIRIREYSEDGYRYAFVEFESPISASRAVKDGEISIGGRKFEVQYKRLPNQGVNHGKSGTGGHSNDNSWGHALEGCGGSNDGESGKSNWRNSSQNQRHGGSSGAARQNGGSSIRM
ncbi:hypothetical protein DCAR_0209156 [Daucus carota subsp. sativus]|uniref:NTF2 domain-containing protein n=1 Tax=Daucus carota subsp. sativus TaxID=79200 RepID=A0AAF0WIC2_DAUCS|nr:hypothetical protein DCAR_0209156 [Daucus carota subsp. sativus]